MYFSPLSKTYLNPLLTESLKTSGQRKAQRMQISYLKIFVFRLSVQLDPEFLCILGS